MSLICIINLFHQHACVCLVQVRLVFKLSPESVQRVLSLFYRVVSQLSSVQSITECIFIFLLLLSLIKLLAAQSIKVLRVDSARATLGVVGRIAS